MSAVPGTDFILEELTAGGVRDRMLTLKQRFLPYRPVKIGGKQRAEFTWYPGQPDAVVQMLGPEEGVIQLQGWWKDRFLEEPISQTSIDNTGFIQAISSVADLVSAVDDMRRMGRRIKLSWSGLVRYEHITSFQQTWHNQHDCEWELEFSVTSMNGTQGVQPQAAPPPVADVGSQVKNEADAIARDIVLVQTVQAQKVSLSEKFFKAMDSFYNSTVGRANGIINSAYGYAQGAFAYSQAVRSTITGLTGVISGAATTLGTVADQALSELYSFNFWGDQDSAPFGVQLASDNLRTTFARQTRETRGACAYLRQEQARADANEADQVQIYTASAFMDLRDVSLIYYGTTEYWRQLMMYNNLTSSRLNGGDTVYVPRVSVFSSMQGSV